MKLESLIASITDIPETNIVRSPTLQKLETKYYSTMIGFCEACSYRAKCKIRMTLDDLDITALKEDVQSYSQEIKTEGLTSDFDIDVAIIKCNKFKKL